MAGDPVTVKAVGWSDVRNRLKSSFEGDEKAIKRDVVTGQAQCWLIGDCAMISRKDGAELVVMCIAGEGLKEVSPIIKAAAKRAGCKTIRAHVKRLGMARILEPIGMNVDEYILRVSL